MDPKNQIRARVVYVNLRLQDRSITAESHLARDKATTPGSTAEPELLAMGLALPALHLSGAEQ